MNSRTRTAVRNADFVSYRYGSAAPVTMPGQPIYGVAINPVTGDWTVFNETTLRALSFHATEAQAINKARDYERMALRRTANAMRKLAALAGQ